MTKGNKGIVVQDTPGDIIRLAVDKGNVDLDKLEKVMHLQREWEAGEARKAYHCAMSDFKANPPEIDKDRTVSYGNTKYNHASLYNVTKKISAELSKHGLSASWSTKQNGQILVTCKITHVKGHSEETTLMAAADSSGSKNAIQAIGSTITYLERYTLLALTGLATSDGDDDGQDTAIEYIDDKQKSEIIDMVTEYKINVDSFLKAYNITEFGKLPKNSYQDARAKLMSKKGVAK